MNEKEIIRLKKLADLDLDYDELKSDFGTLSLLAAKIAGAELSEVNFIDNYTQWTVAGTLGHLAQKPREESICNFTIKEDHHFTSRVDQDPRFKDTKYVKEEGFKFYYGIPLKIGNDISIGTLCIGGKNIEDLSESQIEQLHMIALQIVKHIELKYEVQKSKQLALKEQNLKRQLAHDVRSPLSGIAQLVELTDMSDQSHGQLEELINLIASSAENILQLTTDILKETSLDSIKRSEATFTLSGLASKLLNLYNPQAKSKGIHFNVTFEDSDMSFLRKSILPLLGNLVSNAIKFTNDGGSVSTSLTLKRKENGVIKLHAKVKDSGIGMSEAQIGAILQTDSAARLRSTGDNGFGMGLLFVRELTEHLGGKLKIKSSKTTGTEIKVIIPLRH